MTMIMPSGMIIQTVAEQQDIGAQFIDHPEAACVFSGDQGPVTVSCSSAPGASPLARRASSPAR